jgi:hypothetical protein
VLMFMHDPTATLRQIAERIRPGGIVAFHEWDARVTTALAMNQPVLARLQGLFVRKFERSGARLAGAELYSRMLEIDLEPDPSHSLKSRFTWAMVRLHTLAGSSSREVCSQRLSSTASLPRKRSWTFWSSCATSWLSLTVLLPCHG